MNDRERSPTGTPDSFPEDDDRDLAALRHAAERTRELGNRARQGGERGVDQAGATGRQTTRQIGRALVQTETALERHSVLPTLIRERPLAAVGIAFGAGFLLMAGRGRQRSWLTRQALQRLRRAVLAGVGAAAAAELRTFLHRSEEPGSADTPES